MLILRRFPECCGDGQGGGGERGHGRSMAVDIIEEAPVPDTALVGLASAVVVVRGVDGVNGEDSILVTLVGSVDRGLCSKFTGKGIMGGAIDDGCSVLTTEGSDCRNPVSLVQSLPIVMIVDGGGSWDRQGMGDETLRGHNRSVSSTLSS